MNGRHVIRIRYTSEMIFIAYHMCNLLEARQDYTQIQASVDYHVEFLVFQIWYYWFTENGFPYNRKIFFWVRILKLKLQCIPPFVQELIFHDL